MSCGSKYTFLLTADTTSCARHTALDQILRLANCTARTNVQCKDLLQECVVVLEMARHELPVSQKHDQHGLARASWLLMPHLTMTK